MSKIFFRLFNGKELTVKDGVQTEKDISLNKYILTIQKLNPSIHAGLVTIKATNVVGTAIHEFKLNILGLYNYYSKYSESS